MRAFVLTGSPARRLAPGLCLRLAGPAEALADDDAVRHAIGQARTAGATAITLTGGEVLARPQALDWLHAARSAGFRAVEVRTDGWLLAGAGAARRVVDAGATHVGVELLAHDGAAHDHLANEQGAFARALRALRSCREAGATTRVLAPILRPSFRSLPSMVRRALVLGVSGFDFIAIDGPDRLAHPLLADPAMAAPHVRTAIGAALAARRRVTTWSMPACLLGEYDAYAVERSSPLLFDASVQDAGPILNHFERHQGTPCEGCALASSCIGPMTAEVCRHGWAAYVGRAAPPPPNGDQDMPRSS